MAVRRMQQCCGLSNNALLVIIKAGPAKAWASQVPVRETLDRWLCQLTRISRHESSDFEGLVDRWVERAVQRQSFDA